MLKKALILTLFFLGGCQSGPVGNVVVHGSFPRGNCRQLGQVIGHSGQRENARARSIEDLKYQASMIGGNYVQLMAVTAHGGAARGIAFRCQ